MTDNIKIFISYHKPGFLPKRKYLYPLQVGCAVNGIHLDGMLHDDDGENISEKNPMYCELTGQYWAWKHEDADYYGFFHYRRYMNFSDTVFPHSKFQDVEFDYLTDHALDEIGIDPDRMKTIINQYDVIATSETDIRNLGTFKSTYDHYDKTPYQHKEDIDTILEIIEEKYPTYYDTAVEYLNSPKGYYCNMFIMRREIFQPYCIWLFSILEEHENRRREALKNYGPEALRVSGYLGERLFGIYFTYLKKSGKYKTTELQRTLFKHTDTIPITKPAFQTANVAIAIAANEQFMPYSGVFIQSIMDHASTDHNYDILILTEDAKPYTRTKLLSMLEGHENFSIRFLDPGSLLSEYHLFVRGHFSKETYYRLVLPEILSDYDKIAYIDSDLVTLRDVADLYDTDVTGYLIAATHDADTAGLYNGSEPQKKAYMDSILKMKNPYDYFQAGVLVMNLAEFRKTYTTKQILEYADAYDYELLDQDILNHLCEGRVLYLDIRWNIMVDFNGIRIKENIRNAPKYLHDMYMEGRKNPYIVHYAGPQKPWMSPEMDMAEYFWQYARENVFYERILANMSTAITKRELDEQDASKKKLVDDTNLNPLKEVSAKLLPYDSGPREFIKKIYHFFVHTEWEVEAKELKEKNKNRGK